MSCQSNTATSAERIGLLVLILLLGLITAAAAREVVPAPEPTDPAAAIRAEDQQLPTSGTPLRGASEAYKQQILKALGDQMGSKSGDRSGDIGGDDRLLASIGRMRNSDVTVDSNGDIYVAVCIDLDPTGTEIQVFRSDDGGNRFQTWGWLTDASHAEIYMEPTILACEGIEDRIYLAYRRYVTGSSDSEIRMVYAPLGEPMATFSSEITILSQPDVDFVKPRLASDAVNWNSYFLYLVAEGKEEPGGSDIWFTRSTNRADSFETPYQIGTLAPSDRNYSAPDICYGYDGWVHVAWYFYFPEHEYDATIRYRRAPSYADGGSGSWGNMVDLTGHTNGMDEWRPRVAASPSSPEVVLGYRRSEWHGTYFVAQPSGTFGSYDSGANFDAGVIFSGSSGRILDIEFQPSTEDFIALETFFTNPNLRRTDKSDLGGWSEPLSLGDGEYYTGTSWDIGLGIDPTHDDRVCTAWTDGTTTTLPNDLWFDAEWHEDPGYPNYADGFPRDLTDRAYSHPALVDLNGDGNLEIVFSDVANRIQAIEYDGTNLPGWPVTVPTVISDGPVAVGAMTLSGELSVLIGTAGGQVYGFDQTGTPLDGFPFSMPDAEPAYVAIGAMGGPYPRVAVVCAGPRMRFVSHRGELVPESVGGWISSGATFNTSPAIGDVDGDGVAEAVIAGGTRLLCVDLTSTSSQFFRSMPATITDAVSLGDVDLDGQYEIFVPCDDGNMYQLDGTGGDVPGWPVGSIMARPLTSAAIAQILLGYEPDIVWGHERWSVYGCYHDGSPLPGFPVYAGIHDVTGAPILGDIDNDPGGVGEVIVGSQGSGIWSWSSVGHQTEGWPRYLSSACELGPAMGDIDQDGRTEIVFLTQDGGMHVFDVNHPLGSAHFAWPMYGFDPQRTGCHNCPEDLVSAVDDESDEIVGITRVSLAAPAPNPTSGHTLFTFEIPVRSQVRLDIYDIRGRRINSIFREESVPGVHTCQWDGHDRSGRQLASGVYFATLQVRGPGVDQTLSRKVNLIR